MFSISIFKIFIFSIFQLSVCGASVLAIEEQFPIRTGRIKIQITSPINQTRTYPIVFFLPVPGVPEGIVYGIMTLQILNQSCPYLDYSLVSTDITRTGYTLVVNLAYTYEIKYSNLHLNYFTQGGVPDYLFTFTTFPDTVYVSDSNSSGVFMRTWNWDLSFDTSLAVDYKLDCFIHEMTAYFPSNNFSIWFQHSYDSATNIITVSYSFCSDIVLTTFIPGAIYFNYRIDQIIGQNYELKITMTLDTPHSLQTKAFDLANLPFPNQFIGLKSINCVQTSTKISFVSLYNPTVINYDYLQYTLNPRSMFTFKQLGTPYMDYSISFCYFSRISCVEDTAHPYLDYQAQLCYDICPPKKYTNSSNFCIICTSCPSISICDSCYINGCSIGFFFNTLKLPYKCSKCSSKMTDCSECASNSSGIFCSKCTIDKDLEVSASGQTCIPCNSSSYFHPDDRKCYSCGGISPDCEQCSSGTVCTKCTVISQKQIEVGQCVSCNSSSFYYPDNRTCLLCSSVSSNCEQCTYNTALTVRCISCSAVSKTTLNNSECLPCNSTSFYNSPTKNCILCQNLFPNCEQCSSSNQNSCIKCLVTSQTILEGGACISCKTEQFFNSASVSCHTCQSKISGCDSCQIVVTGILVCKSCDPSLPLELSGNQCLSCNSSSYFDNADSICHSCESSIPGCAICQLSHSNVVECHSCQQYFEYSGNQCIGCNSTSYFDTNDQLCHSCSSDCISCSSVSVCLQCAYSPNIILRNGACVLCNPNSDDLNSSLLFCNQPANTSLPVGYVNCVLSTYNQATKKCELVETPEMIMHSFTMVASVPTINMFTRAFGALIGLFDDLSYYNYHGRNYSTSVEMFFESMNDFTLTRFLPFQLNKVYDALSFTYSQKILKETFTTVPKQFQETDGSVYFLRNTQSIWTLSLPLSLVFFLFFFCVHWTINRFVKNNFFKNYNYFGMIMVDQVGSNIQYFTFRVFSQFSQLVIFGPIYYFNLTISYLVLFVVLLYSVTSSVVFTNIYTSTNPNYILSDLFGQSWVVWFNLSNLLKMFTGFVHGYFYHSPLMQTVLLTFAYTAKTIIYLRTFKYIQSRFQFTFELFSNFLMMILQFFFLSDMLLINKHQYSASREDYHGSIECLIIMSMIITQITSILAAIIKNGVLFCKKKVKNKPKKQVVSDIRIVKNWNPKLQNSFEPQIKKLQNASNVPSQIIFQLPHKTDKSPHIVTHQYPQQTESQTQINQTRSSEKIQTIRENKKKSKFQVTFNERAKLLQCSDPHRNSQKKIENQDSMYYLKFSQSSKGVIVPNFSSEDIQDIQQFQLSKEDMVQKELKRSVCRSKKGRMQSSSKYCSFAQGQGTGKQLCLGGAQIVSFKEKDGRRYYSEDV